MTLNKAKPFTSNSNNKKIAKFAINNAFNVLLRFHVETGTNNHVIQL